MVYRKTLPSTATVQKGRTQTQSTVHHPPEVAWETETEKQLDTVFLTITLPSITLPSTHCSPVHPHTLSLTVVSSARGKLYLSTTSRHAFEPPPLPVCMQKSHQGQGILEECCWSFALVACCDYCHNCPLGEVASLFSSGCCSQFSPSY